MPISKRWKHRKLDFSSKSCDRRSFRRVRSGKALITICCPKGQWMPRKKRCKVGTRGTGLDKPRFGSIRVPAGWETPMAMGSEIPYTVFRQSRDYLYGWNWRSDDTGKTGLGYRTRKSATEAAIRDAYARHGGRL